MELVTFDTEYPRWDAYLRRAAYRVLRRYGFFSQDLEDAYQEACCAFVEAIREYNAHPHRTAFPALVPIWVDRRLDNYCRWASRGVRDMRRFAYLDDFEEIAGRMSGDDLQAALDFETLLDTARRGLGAEDALVLDALLSASGLRTLARGATIFGVSREELMGWLNIPAWRAAAGTRSVIEALRGSAIQLQMAPGAA